MSNQNEGNTFVNANETLTVTDYISQLFPDMTYSEVQEAALVYQGYGTALEQAILVNGDCKSPTRNTNNSFTWTLLCSHYCLPDLLLAPGIRWSFMEGQSFELLTPITF